MNSETLGRVGILVVMLMSISVMSLMAEMFIWDNDNYSTIDDPEGAGYMGCEYAITKALNNLSVSYTVLSYLPTNLQDYDMLFITLGHWCFG